MSESRAKELGYTPLGFLRGYAFPALDPRENMLLGNVYACPDALDRSGATLQDMDLVEIHEAFAAQVLSNLKCFADADFFKEKLGRDKPIGVVDPDKLNIWGGSMAYGHPFAATGGRILINLLHGLRQTDGTLGLATACAAGGLGSAMVIERNR
jgi:acetyl-CoA acyltransferase